MCSHDSYLVSYLRLPHHQYPIRSVYLTVVVDHGPSMSVHGACLGGCGDVVVMRVVRGYINNESVLRCIIRCIGKERCHKMYWEVIKGGVSV